MARYRALAASAGAAAFAPTDLPNLKVWVEGDKITGLANGASISTLTESSPNATVFTQATGTKQPTYAAVGVVNGKPAITFDGGDGLSSASGSLGATCSIYAVVVSTLNSGFRRIFSNELNVYFGEEANNWSSFYGNNSAWGTSANHGATEAILTGQPYVVASINDGDDHFYVNGKLINTRTNPMTAFSDGFQIGAQAAGITGQFWQGSIPALIVYDGAHSAADRLLVERYLNDKYAVAHFPLLTKSGSNPIVAMGAAASWEDSDVANPEVCADTIAGGFLMTYSGYDGASWHTGLATASDPAGPFTKWPGNPILSPSTGEGAMATNGSTVIKGSTYYHFYNDATPEIRLATSPDRVTWTRHASNPVLRRGAAGELDDQDLGDPMVRLKSDGTFECWYKAASSVTGIKIAKATSPDGVTWTKQGIMFAAPSFALLNLGEPAMFEHRGIWYVFHDAATVANTRFIVGAWSPDQGTTWYRQRLVLPAGSGWESVQVFDNHPFVYNGTLYLYYGGATATGAFAGFNGQIGVATAPWPW